MAKTGEKKAKDQKGQDMALEMRRIVSNAYGFVQGQAATQAFSALTFEDLMDQQIETIEGDPRNGRPNQLDRIKKTASELRETANKIKAVDPKEFDDHDEEQDTNTKV
jgi:hypothetical protein